MSRPVTSCVNTLLRRYLPILNRGVQSTLVKHFPAIVTNMLILRSFDYALLVPPLE
jgi:hypothetical protein